MSSTPPPPPGYPPVPPPPGQPPTPPPYQPYGGPVNGGPQRTNGMSIASLVLSLVGLIPCFWAFPITAVLGVIFGAVGRRQIANSHGAQKGHGLALAGLIIGIILLVLAVVFWIAIAVDKDHCISFGNGTCWND